MTQHALLVGPHGVTGTAIGDRLEASPDWKLTTVSRRGVSQRDDREHISADLLDETTGLAALSGLSSVTHLVYAGYTDRTTMAEAVGPNVDMLANTLDGLRAAGAELQHVVVIGGGKSYGEHLGDYKTPAKESDPRLLGPIFYNDQEDLLVERSRRDGFGWTVLRPDLVIGFSLGSPMNLLNSIGVYAALSKEAGVPLRFPGSARAWTALHQFTDAEVLAAAVEWALGSDAARGEIYNVTNGDNFRWQHLWSDIADVFDMPTAPRQPMSLAEQMADKEPAWDRLVESHRLVPTPWSRITGWDFADGIFSSGFDMVQSTVKIRQAGFQDCVDSHHSLTEHLARLRKERYLP